MTARVRVVMLGVLVAVTLAALFGALAFRASGGRWYVVQTPSMGRAAPVGSLVFTRPARVAEVRVGDIVTFTAPGSTQTHTHRVRVNTGAMLLTRGDINGADDPLPTTDATLVGRVVTVVPAVGWLVRMLPVLLAGALVWLLMRSRLESRRHRFDLDLVGPPLIFAVASIIYRPWVGVVLLTTASAEGATTARVVSTGLLPTTASVQDGSSVQLLAGQVGDVVTGAAGRVQLLAQPSLHGLLLLAAAVFVCSPAVASCVLAALREETPEAEDAGPSCIGARPVSS